MHAKPMSTNSTYRRVVQYIENPHGVIRAIPWRRGLLAGTVRLGTNASSEINTVIKFRVIVE